MTAVLEIRGIAKQFGGLSALDGVAFTVGEGELVGLVGPNGAGKSTLFNIIAGALPPTRGQVLLRGRDVTDLSSHDRARHGIARTFQQVTLFSELTALDNVLQGLHRHVPPRFVAGLLGTPAYRREQRELGARALRILDALGIGAHRDEIAGEQPLGIQKLLTVAVALATEPTVLLLDEPAAGLSHEESTRMMDLVSTVIRQPNSAGSCWSSWGSAVLAPSRTVTVAEADSGVGSGLTSTTVVPRASASSGSPAAG